MPTNSKGVPPFAQRLRRAPPPRPGVGKGPASGPQPQLYRKDVPMQARIDRTVALAEAGNPVLRREAEALLRVVLECRSRVAPTRPGPRRIGSRGRWVSVSSTPGPRTPASLRATPAAAGASASTWPSPRRRSC